jgi:hypothetical protein
VTSRQAVAGGEQGGRATGLISKFKSEACFLGSCLGEIRASEEKNTHVFTSFLSQVALSFLPPVCLLFHGIFSVAWEMPCLTDEEEEEGEQARLAHS